MWPGNEGRACVVRVRERGTANAQEVTEGMRQSTDDLLWPSATRTINCPGHQQTYCVRAALIACPTWKKSLLMSVAFVA